MEQDNKNEFHQIMCDVTALSRINCKRPIDALLAYAVKENFIGRPIDGYTPGVTDFALMSRKSAEALCQVQNELVAQHDLGLLIFDSFRPKRAVMDFMQWAQAPLPSGAQGEYELARKAIHYPHIEKNKMFDLGYVSLNSQHCYGHTVDLVLIDAKGNELPLGAPFDFMDEISHITKTADEIGVEAFKNRRILSEAMVKFGFVPYKYEFWHFSHREKEIFEPMDVVITAELRGLNVK